DHRLLRLYADRHVAPTAGGSDPEEVSFRPAPCAGPEIRGFRALFHRVLSPRRRKPVATVEATGRQTSRALRTVQVIQSRALGLGSSFGARAATFVRAGPDVLGEKTQ